MDSRSDQPMIQYGAPGGVKSKPLRGDTRNDENRLITQNHLTPSRARDRFASTTLAREELKWFLEIILNSLT